MIHVGSFTLTSVIAEGGMAQVWEGHHSLQEVNVAVKVITAAVSGDSKQEHTIRSLFRNEVRAMAAYTLHRMGDKAEAREAFNQLLRESTYASLKVFNIIDWIGEGIGPHREAMIACSSKASHIGSYVDRMKQYFGLQSAAKKKKPRKKKK